MLDLLWRTLRHLNDYLPARHCYNVTLIEKRHEGGDIYSFFFTPPPEATWRAGQHAVWYLNNSQITDPKPWRAFSISSSPHEEIIRITTRISETPSEFKKQLLAHTPGATLRMRGPFGEFYPHHTPTHIVGIAGGVGITPFRALAYDIAHGHIPQTQLTLIYASSADHIFAHELQTWSELQPAIQVIYTHTPEETSRAVHDAITNHQNTVEYFLSGSPGMITSITKDLRAQGITHIVSDPFKGY